MMTAVSIVAVIGNLNADFLGAEEVLRQAAEKAGQPIEEPEVLSASSQLKQALESFGEESTSLAEEEAAGEWLNLSDRLRDLPYEYEYSEFGEETGPSVQGLIQVLPSPERWGALDTAVDEREDGAGAELQWELGLKLLVETLNEDRPGQKETANEIAQWMSTIDPNQNWSVRYIAQQLNEALLESTEDPNVLFEMLQRRISRLASSEGNEQLVLPDIVVTLGEERAESILRSALVLPNVSIEIGYENATKAMARDLALEMVEELKQSQWSLVSSLDSVDLYEALEKQFSSDVATDLPTNPDDLDFAALLDQLGDSGNSVESYAKNRAKSYYLLGLIAQERYDDAVALIGESGESLVVNLSYDILSSLEQAGYLAQLSSFFHDLLEDNPQLNYWEVYFGLAIKSGQIDEMLALARQAAEVDSVRPQMRLRMKYYLSSALLAADQIEEGLAELENSISLMQESSGAIAQDYVNLGSLGIKLMQLGQLLERDDLLTGGEQIVRDYLETHPVTPSNYEASAVSAEFVSLLVETGKAEDAEQILLTKLANAIKASEDSDSYSAGSDEREQLLSLAWLYHEAGRNDDVMALFEKAPNWYAEDLAEFFSEHVGYYFSEDITAGYLVANALAESGRNNEALPIVLALLDVDGGNDRLYELLINIEGESAMPHLQRLIERDRFEERPLIWKAVLLQRQGQLADAEQTIRQAISIDPSDGEQGVGDRLRAYAVLADILESRGTFEETETLRGEIEAIRESEQADRFNEAGLISRAVDMYRNSLDHFVDAYCIQSRLAIRLADLGRYEEAETHYRKAYELMPDSFGRVESHCFGCERVFDGARAQNTAERVFAQLIEETPEKPQLHYLLGYLREEQMRYSDALAHYRDAVELDPDYLNAWVKIAQLSNYVRSSANDRNLAVVNQLRLDPLQRHSYLDLSKVSDLGAVWNAVKDAQEYDLDTPESLFELEGSVGQTSPAERELIQRYSAYLDEGSMEPGQAIQRNEFIQIVIQMLQGYREAQANSF